MEMPDIFKRKTKLLQQRLKQDNGKKNIWRY
jgi:hypothetical protein